MEVAERIVKQISEAQTSSQSIMLEQIDQFLKESPTSINEKIKKGYLKAYGTLLHWSCIYNLDEIVKYLLSRKEIDTSVKFSACHKKKFYHEFNNKTAFEIATYKNDDKIIALFSGNIAIPQQATDNSKPLIPNPLPPFIAPLITPPPYQTTPSHDEMTLSTPPISRNTQLRGESETNVLNMSLEENVKQLQNEVEKLKNQLIQIENQYLNEISQKDLEIQDLNNKLNKYENQQDIDVPYEGFTNEVDFTALMTLKQGEVLQTTKTTIHQIYHSILDDELEEAMKCGPESSAHKINSYFASLNYTIKAVNSAENQYGADDKYVALSVYTAESGRGYSFYNILNKALTEGRNVEGLEKWKHYLIHMKNALKDLPIFHATPTNPLFRGVPDNLLNKYHEKYQLEKEITFWPFTSTTAELKKAKDFTKGAEVGTIFKIVESLSGRDIHKYSRQGLEREVLFPPCSKFLVKAIEEMHPVGEKLYILITIAQIPGDDPFGLEVSLKQSLKNQLK